MWVVLLAKRHKKDGERKTQRETGYNKYLVILILIKFLENLKKTSTHTYGVLSLSDVRNMVTKTSLFGNSVRRFKHTRLMIKKTFLLPSVYVAYTLFQYSTW